MIRAGFLLGLAALLLAGCDPAEKGCADGEEDAWTDVGSCDDYGTTQRSGSAGYDETYIQCYDAVYDDEYETACVEV